MAPFFKRANAAASLQADIASLLKRRAVLEKQHDEAQNSAAAKMRAARDLLLADGADPVAIETAENAIRDAEIAVRTRADALVEIGRQIAEVEGKAAKLAEDRQRKQTADEIGAMSAEIGPAGTAAIDALNTLAEVAGRAGTVTADATGVKLACERFAADLPAALELVESLLTSHAQAVLTGHAPATLRQPEAAPTQRSHRPRQPCGCSRRSRSNGETRAIRCSCSTGRPFRSVILNRVSLRPLSPSKRQSRSPTRRWLFWRGTTPRTNTHP